MNIQLRQRRPGFYVEDTFFRDRFYQARARAIHLANQYGRPVELVHLDHISSRPKPVLTVFNKSKPT